MLERFPDGLVSVVSDSYDVFHAVSNIWGGELRQYVVNRANKGCLVIRPDSGDPCQVVVKVNSGIAVSFLIRSKKIFSELSLTYLGLEFAGRKVSHSDKFEGFSSFAVIFESDAGRRY